MAKAQRQIYLLNPKKLSPETIAVTFAKTSRSPLSFSEIAAELTDEKSAEFHERWVVGYGHASVAEHAVLHIAIENVSRLAIETIESNRLAAYTEKSTRYQKWSPDSFHIPTELEGHPLLSLYLETIQTLFETYAKSMEAVRPVIAAETPRRDGESETAWERRVRTQTIDVCRYLLPAASLANVGMTANARVLEHAIQKLLSSPLVEVHTIGQEMKRVSQVEIPTLIKYAEQAPYLVAVSQALPHAASLSRGKNLGDWCQMVAWDPHGEEKVLAAALYRYNGVDFNSCVNYIQGIGADEYRRLASIVLGGMSDHDIPLRELEHSVYSFDVVMDQGAYFEFKRHRMMTQTPQALTSRLGYAVPRGITQAGFEDQYRQVMEKAAHAYEQLAAWNPAVASYVAPNGFNRRMMLTFNLREAFHFLGLRSSDRAHFAVRRVARRIAEQIQSIHPVLAAYFSLPQDESWKKIEADYFSAV
jgi:thymidylate synthase ThyX